MKSVSRPWDGRIPAALITLIGGLGLTFAYFGREKVYTETDLRAVSGRLSQYSFTHGSRGSHQYYIFLNNYKATFQVRADDLGLFDQIGFERAVHSGDLITFKISKRSFQEDLNTSDRIHLFSISNGEEIFLRSGGTIERNKSIAPLIMGSAFLIAATLLILSRGYKPSSSKPSKRHKPPNPPLNPDATSAI